MAYPTISITRKALRQRASRRLDDLITGLATGGSTTTMTATTPDLDIQPVLPSTLLHSELSLVAGTSSVVSRRIITHANSTGTVTLTVRPAITTPDATTEFEIHNYNGRGFTKSQYDDAINAAIDELADGAFTDYDTVPFATENIGPAFSAAMLPRNEYPMPPGYNYLYAVDYLGTIPTTSFPLSRAISQRSFGDTKGIDGVWQGFQVQIQGYYEWFSFGLGRVGSPTDALTMQIMTDDGTGKPSGSIVTNGTSSTVSYQMVGARYGYNVFRFDAPVYLAASTQYHMVITRSTAANADHFYIAAEDTNGNYGYGTAGTYNSAGGTYTAIPGSDFTFTVIRASSLWMPFKQGRRNASDGWQYRRVGGDQIFLPHLPQDGIPCRIRGLAAISEISASETATIPIRPDHCEAYTLKYLLSGRAGRQLQDNYAQTAAVWAQNVLAVPRPQRALPAGSIEVFV